MNFFPARLEQSDESLAVKAGGLSVRLLPEFASRINDRSGKDVILGVRPEDIHDARRFVSTEGGQQVTAKVDIVEHMGNENFVYLRSGEASFMARMDRAVQTVPGDLLPIVIDAQKVHLFEPGSERALLSNCTR